MVKKEFYKNQASTIIKNLKSRSMEGYYFETAAEAVKDIMKRIGTGKTIASGGSMSVEESGLMKAIKESDNTFIDRLLAKTDAEKDLVLQQTVVADYYVMSTNAITLDGQLVNIDGNGNRVASLICGPKEVIILAGMNKVCKDVEAAIDRVHNFAAPPNTVRLNIDTPCKSLGVCGNCLKNTICCQTVITRSSRINGRIKVYLVGEELGY